MSRRDLMEVEWRILKVVLPVERKPGKRGRDEHPRTIATSSTAFCSGCVPAHVGTRSIGAFGDGAPAVSGRAWPTLSLKRGRRADITTSMFAPKSWQRPKNGIWPLAGSFAREVIVSVIPEATAHYWIKSVHVA